MFVFNPVLYAAALIENNLEKMEVYKFKSFEKDSAMAAWIDKNGNVKELTPADLFPWDVLEDYGEIYKTEIIDTEGDFSRDVFAAIQDEYGYMMAHLYAEKKGRQDRLHFYFYPCKKSKPCSNKFRDTANLNSGYMLQDAENMENGLNHSRNIIDIRGYYSASKTTAYCALWYSYNDHFDAGFGKAGGAGYDKLNSALIAACRSVGLTPVRNYGGFKQTAEALATYAAIKRPGKYIWTDFNA